MRYVSRCGRAAAVVVGLTLVGCGSHQGSSTAEQGGAPAGAGVSLTGAGATFPYPLYSKWFDEYKAKTGVAINYQSIGSGGGIQQLKAGTVDFGASDAPLDDAQLKEMPRAVVHVPTVGGAVVLAYNLPGTGAAVRLTPEAIAGIFLGTLKTWNAPAIASANPGVALPATPILAVHRSDGSGTSNIFTTYLSKVSPAWKSKVGAGTAVSWPAGVGGKGNDGVSGLVRQSPGSIGYVELAYARQNRLAMASIRNHAGSFVEPSLRSTLAAIEGAAGDLARDVRVPVVEAPGDSAYPIAALTFLLLYQDQQDAARAKAMVDFVRWALHDGQADAEALDYVRLPEALVTANEATLARLTAAGKPIALRGAGAARRVAAAVSPRALPRRGA